MAGKPPGVGVEHLGPVESPWEDQEDAMRRMSRIRTHAAPRPSSQRDTHKCERVAWEPIRIVRLS